MKQQIVPVTKMLENHANKSEADLKNIKYMIKMTECLLGKADDKCSINLVMEDLIEQCDNHAICIDEFSSLTELLYSLERYEHKVRMDYIDTKNLIRHHEKNNPKKADG